MDIGLLFYSLSKLIFYIEKIQCEHSSAFENSVLWAYGPQFKAMKSITSRRVPCLEAILYREILINHSFKLYAYIQHLFVKLEIQRNKYMTNNER